MKTIPRLALVGRPNVGKSTLFNRICGRRKAITDSRPGSTRDRNYAQASWQGAAFEIVDTGGLLLGTDDPMLGPAAVQADRAIAESDRVVLIVDARAGLLPDDAAIAKQLRQAGKEFLLAVNKTEGKSSGIEEFASLGAREALAISADHGQGVGDLLDAALEGLPKVEAPEEGTRPIRVAIVGRPNVGKSSLLNRLTGEERALVSDIAGTTRDAVDSLITRGERTYQLVDTAGIRKQRLLKETVDHVSVVQAKRAIDRADVAVLVLDAEEGLREMDATIGGLIQEAGTGVVVAINKWDLAQKRSAKQKTVEQDFRDGLKFLHWAPICFISAHTGRGVPALLETVAKVRQACALRITTGELNRVVAKASEKYAPKAKKGSHDVRILYASQIGIEPPTIALSLNHPVDLHFSWQRYLENQLREAFDFGGSPIFLKVRTRKH
ncbi:MAG: ribosome biogenesis GTPase Der [Vicinamibacteria bacterium]|nr:ribosome biogenesis GTPase Der [Vicinamibacteria bacterium]